MYGLDYYVNSTNLEQPGDIIRGYLENVIGFIVFYHNPRITTKFAQLLQYQVVLWHWKGLRLLCQWYFIRKNNHIWGMKINVNDDSVWFWGQIVTFLIYSLGFAFVCNFLFAVSLRQAVPESKRNAKKTFGDGICCEYCFGVSQWCVKQHSQGF